MSIYTVSKEKYLGWIGFHKMCINIAQTFSHIHKTVQSQNLLGEISHDQT